MSCPFGPWGSRCVKSVIWRFDAAWMGQTLQLQQGVSCLLTRAHGCKGQRSGVSTPVRRAPPARATNPRTGGHRPKKRLFLQFSTRLVCRPVFLAVLHPWVRNRLSQAFGVLFCLEPPRCHLPRLEPLRCCLPRLEPRHCSKSWTAVPVRRAPVVSRTFSSPAPCSVSSLCIHRNWVKNPRNREQGDVESEVSPASEVLVLLVLLPRHPSGCPFSSSPRAVLPQCLLSSAPPAGVAGAGSAAISCAAAGSGCLIGVELCAGGKGNTSGSSATAFNLPGCPLTANKSCWSAASLGASLRVDLAVETPCLVKMMFISAKLSRPAQMPTPHFSLKLST